MDELTIGDKKYVSSKRAAKLTGYAKDYVGQLCREGRVPARLVGRAWYVLESAIQDHRFGDDNGSKEEAASIAGESEVWESPKYEADAVESLPSVNRIHDVEPVKHESENLSQHLQDSWKAWFDRVAAPTSEVGVATESVRKAEEPAAKPLREDIVPIRAIHHAPIEPLPDELLPRRVASRIPTRPEALEASYAPVAPRRGTSKGVRYSLQFAGALVALIMASLAIAGTGYFDTFAVSHTQVGAAAGVYLYNR